MLIQDKIVIPGRSAGPGPLKEAVEGVEIYLSNFYLTNTAPSDSPFSRRAFGFAGRGQHPIRFDGQKGVARVEFGDAGDDVARNLARPEVAPPVGRDQAAAVGSAMALAAFSSPGATIAPVASRASFNMPALRVNPLARPRSSVG